MEVGKERKQKMGGVNRPQNKGKTHNIIKNDNNYSINKL